VGTGSGQGDNYTYDPKTGRMTNWGFQVGSAGETGALYWNANGTLEDVVIVDGFNAGGTQTCSFNSSLVSGTGYDDLGRLVGSSCGSGGSPWNQGFIFDQYDNLTKSSKGFVSWNPGYSQTTNHYSTTGCPSCTYDASGNVTNDGTNAYTWNGYAKMASVNNTSGTGCGSAGCLVYDALGRVVEIDGGATPTEIWYTQLGKTAYMNGTTENYAYWPAPGGATALYNGSVYFMHKDWLGSSRLTSLVSSSPSVTSDRAIAPYGEIYDIFGSTNQNQAMFTGDTQDVTAGMYDTPNRELQGSQQGRFLSPDPANFGWNQYAYPTNPNSMVDPSGLCPPIPGCPLPNQGIGYTTQPDAQANDYMGVFLGIELGAEAAEAVPPYVWTPVRFDILTVSDYIILLNEDGTLDYADMQLAGQSTNYVVSGGFWTATQQPVPLLSAANNGPQQPQQQQPQQSRLNQASKAALHTFVFGQAIGTGVGCGVGLLVAGGATAATETYPLAGATLPAGCIGGGMIGFFEALPYSTLGAIADFGWTYWGH
jgi:RHS repeat-associated protein